MLEILLGVGGGSGRTYYPESGPGNKELLKGNSNAGYFGEVTATELFSSSEVDLLATLGTGTVVSTSFTWLKFIYKGNFLYIAKKQLRSTVSWNDLYNAGAVYGERGEGRVVPSTGGVDQFKFKVKNDTDGRWFLKLRLPRGLAVDPGATTDVAGSEWNDLIHRVIVGDNSVIGRWDNIPVADFCADGSNVRSLVMETDVSNVNGTFYRGQSSIVNVTSTTKANASTAICWRPVLELFNPDGIAFEPQEPKYTVDIPLAPDLRLEGILDNVAFNPTQVYKVADPLPGVAIVSAEAQQIAQRPSAVSFNVSAMTPLPIVLDTVFYAKAPSDVQTSISALKPVAIQLSTF